MFSHERVKKTGINKKLSIEMNCAEQEGSVEKKSCLWRDKNQKGSCRLQILHFIYFAHWTGKGKRRKGQGKVGLRREYKRAWEKIRDIVKIGCGRVGVVIAKEEQKKTGSLVLEGKRPLVLCCKFCRRPSHAVWIKELSDIFISPNTDPIHTVLPLGPSLPTPSRPSSPYKMQRHKSK